MAGKPKGLPKSGGRKKGTPNKISGTVKQDVATAFAKLGGVDWLVNLGTNDPRSFVTLLAKVMPTEIDGSLDLMSDPLIELLERIDGGTKTKG